MKTFKTIGVAIAAAALQAAVQALIGALTGHPVAMDPLSLTSTAATAATALHLPAPK